MITVTGVFVKIHYCFKIFFSTPRHAQSDKVYSNTEQRGFYRGFLCFVANGGMYSSVRLWPDTFICWSYSENSLLFWKYSTGFKNESFSNKIKLFSHWECSNVIINKKQRFLFTCCSGSTPPPLPHTHTPVIP